MVRAAAANPSLYVAMALAITFPFNVSQSLRLRDLQIASNLVQFAQTDRAVDHRLTA
ncbi:MAG: hypothetical protein FJ145_26290, partial [Deltaproteobacteria bacterium]|nr:hypothetical protein [Deltaproteobacteria bacterium]